MPVGGKLFAGGRVAAGAKTGFLGPLDLRDTTVVDDQLHDPVTEPFDLFANERDPVRQSGGGGGRRV